MVDDLNQCSHMTEPSPFSADSTLIDALSERAVPVSCPEDRVLFRQGEECLGLFVLRTGHATLEMQSNIGEVVARFAMGAGSLLGTSWSQIRLSQPKYYRSLLLKRGKHGRLW